MITPGTAPEGAYVPGTGFGQSYQGMTPEQARAQLTSPFTNSFGDIGQILSQTLSGILEAVVNGIVAGAQAVGMLVTGVINTISGAIQWVADGIASLFGAGNPTFEVGSSLADAYDKQQELIGKVDELMVDNAGFINLCMSKNQRINWTPNKWLITDFDTYVTEHKNARGTDVLVRQVEDPEVITNYLGPSGWGRGKGFVFDAPGVWSIDGQLTLEPGPNVTAYRYFEMELRVYEAARDNSGSNGAGLIHYTTGVYSTTRVATGTITSRIATTPIHKPVLIPDDGKTYVAVLATRIQTDRQFNTWGGARWSSLSAVRHSVDTIDYTPPEEATGSVTISN